MALPAEERRELRPLGRECEARGCTNLIAPSARADARYRSDACRKKARRDAKRHEIDCHALDTVPPENLAASVQETQQNQGSKTGPQKPQGFSDAAQARGCTNLIAPTARVDARTVLRRAERRRVEMLNATKSTATH